MLCQRNKRIPDRIITHQANINIIIEISKRTNILLDKYFSNLDRYANTAGASVVIALAENLDLNPHDEHIFLVVFGGGLSWGGVYLKKMGAS